MMTPRRCRDDDDDDDSAASSSTTVVAATANNNANNANANANREKAPTTMPSLCCIKRSTTVKTKKAPGAPKRFRPAFIFFSAEMHKEIRAQIMCEKNKQNNNKSSSKRIRTAELSIIVANAWKNLSPDEKSKWEKLAHNDKQRFDLAKTTYKGPWRVPIAPKEKMDPNAPKQPMSAYLAFANSRRAEVTRTEDGCRLSNAEVSKKLADMWKTAPDDVRQKYLKEAAEARQKHELVMAEWEMNQKESQQQQSVGQQQRCQQQQQQQQQHQDAKAPPITTTDESRNRLPADKSTVKRSKSNVVSNRNISDKVETTTTTTTTTCMDTMSPPSVVMDNNNNTNNNMSSSVDDFSRHHLMSPNPDFTNIALLSEQRFASSMPGTNTWLRHNYHQGLPHLSIYGNAHALLLDDSSSRSLHPSVLLSFHDVLSSSSSLPPPPPPIADPPCRVKEYNFFSYPGLMNNQLKREVTTTTTNNHHVLHHQSSSRSSAFDPPSHHGNFPEPPTYLPVVPGRTKWIQFPL